MEGPDPDGPFSVKFAVRELVELGKSVTGVGPVFEARAFWVQVGTDVLEEGAVARAELALGGWGGHQSVHVCHKNVRSCHRRDIEVV